MTVSFFSCNDAPNKITKSFSAKGSAECSVYKACNIMSPSLLLTYSSSLETANYFQCFGRYYTIVGLTLLPGGRCVLSGAVDVLASYSSQILGLNVYAYRTGNLYLRNKLVTDDGFTAETKINTDTCLFSSTPFNTQNYVLTVIGGV